MPRVAIKLSICKQFCFPLLLWLTLFSVAESQENWPQFRGPGARGIGDGENLPSRWSASENIEWQREIPGRGWSSPVVWGERVFLTSVINSGEMEEAKKGLYFGGERLKPSQNQHRWMVYCLDLISGETIWEREVHAGVPKTAIHIKGSYASETAATDGERVYFCFGNLGIYCFDFDGNPVWKHELEPRTTRLGWGTAASPVVHDGRLYFVNDNEESSYLMALNATDGAVLWKTPREEATNWATPFVWKNSLRTEIVTAGTGGVRSYDESGRLLWSLHGMSSITIATPYEHDGNVVVSSGYVMDPRRPIYVIRPGAEGDISLEDDATSSDFVVWAQPRAAPYNPSTIVYQGGLYVLYDRGMVSCLSAQTGEILFDKERLKGEFTSSPWAYDGKVFCLNEDGVTFVLEASDQFKLLHENRLEPDDMGMATPAIVGDRLLIRTAARIYSIRKMEKE
jgi:outer membrane protein assembly factor BamB